MTKETISERAVLKIPQILLDEELKYLKEYLPHIQDLKEGKIEPTECGRCNYCKLNKKTTNVYNYNEYFEMRGGF